MKKSMVDKTQGRKKRLFDKGNIFYFVLAVVLATLLVVIAVLKPTFYTAMNLTNILVQVSALCTLTIALTFIFITGGIDISSMQVVVLAGIVSAIVIQATGSIILGILTIFVVTMLCGLFISVAVTKFKMMPFIVTLAVQIIAEGIGTLVCRSKALTFPTNFTNISNFKIGPIPMSFVFLVIVLIVSYYLLNRSKFGRWVYAVGINKESAQACGIPVSKVLLGCYMFSSVLIGISTIITVSKNQAVSMMMVTSTSFFDVICAAVIGGASVYGGVGSVSGALFGSVFVVVLGNCINLFSVKSFTAMIIKGLAILVMTSYDTYRNRSKVGVKAYE